MRLVLNSPGSWALPLRHERITSWENPIDKAVWQLKQVCKELPSRPITLWDIEYGCTPFVIKTAEINADKLMRLRSNLCLSGEPPQYSRRGKPRGCHRQDKDCVWWCIDVSWQRTQNQVSSPRRTEIDVLTRIQPRFDPIRADALILLESD